MPVSFARETITRLRAELDDANSMGDQEYDWTTPDEADIPYCVVTPGATEELAIGRDTTLIQWTVIAPKGADVLASDRIKLKDGKTYEVDGEPAVWTSPSGLLDSVVLFLRKWEG